MCAESMSGVQGRRNVRLGITRRARWRGARMLESAKRDQPSPKLRLDKQPTILIKPAQRGRRDILRPTFGQRALPAKSCASDV